MRTSTILACAASVPRTRTRSTTDSMEAWKKGDDKGQGVLLAIAVSRLAGWLYFAAWTLSFWPQALLIYRRKSVAGVSLDFLALNFFGFVCYAIFNVSFLLSSTVQEQYKRTHRGQENLVRWNDAFFALHAVLIAAWQLSATFYYKRAPSQRISTWAQALLGVLVSVFVLALATCTFLGGGEGAWLRWLDFVNICSYIKLLITLVKYTPQALLNVQRQSTLGFAIQGVTLDLTGGLLSLLQLVIDASLINHNWSDVTGDPGKLGLSFISLFFDVILLTQHYIIYGSRPVADEEEDDDSIDHRHEDEERRRLLD